MKTKYGFFQNLKRMCRYRLLIPLIRSAHSPEHNARGVAVGVAWAMTPLVGIQMTLVAITWGLLKKVFKWDFSLPLAIAFTWITNVATLVPIYYVFYVTGQMMQGHWDSISGYSQLQGILAQTFLSDLTIAEEWTLFFKLLLQDWGVAMAIGCLPWALICGVASYYMTLRFCANRARQRELRKKGK